MHPIGRALVSAVLLASACQTIPVHRDAFVAAPVVLPNRMCAARGRVAVSNDKPGERMICEMQTPLGTHVPECTCWDEGLLAEKHIDTQEAVQRLETSLQKCGIGTGACGAGGAGR